MRFTIYCVTNKSNAKRYVGQTRRTLQERWAGHCCDAKRDRIAASMRGNQNAKGKRRGGESTPALTY